MKVHVTADIVTWISSPQFSAIARFRVYTASGGVYHYRDVRQRRTLTHNCFHRSSGAVHAAKVLVRALQPLDRRARVRLFEIGTADADDPFAAATTPADGTTLKVTAPGLVSPVNDCSTGELHGAGAECKWRAADRGRKLLSAVPFPAAERTAVLCCRTRACARRRVGRRQ